MTPFGIPNMMSEIVLFSVVKRFAGRSPVAVLIPEDISMMAVPPGERKFYLFPKILFESRTDVIGWHSVRVCGEGIDFALLITGMGLFVLDVKDWKHANILSTRGIM